MHLKIYSTVKILLITFCFSILSFISIGQYIATPPVQDGVINAVEYGSNQISNAGYSIYMNWDVNKLYIGMTGPVNAATIIYLDKDNLVPVNGGSSANGVTNGQLYDNTNFAPLPFKADLVLYIKTGSVSYRVNNSGVWSSALVANINYNDNGVNTISGVKELSIDWSVIGGIPASFNFFTYNTTAAGNVYGSFPATNGSGFIGTSRKNERYYNVTSTLSTPPFSRECYVYNNGSPENNFGAISVYDFTMNTSGSLITRSSSAGGDWNIGGTMVIGNGTVDFGSSGPSFGYTNINNINISEGNFFMDQAPLPLNVSGTFKQSGGTIAFSNAGGGDLNLGGDFIKSGGSFNTNSRRITFNGNVNQNWTSTTSENIDFLTVSNTSGSLNVYSSISAGGNPAYQGFEILSNATYIQQSGTLTINNSAKGYIAGNLFNNSTANNGNSIIIPTVSPNTATIQVWSLGAYYHNIDRGSIPPFVWLSGSNCQVTGWGSQSLTLGGLTQNFYNFTWNSPSQTVNEDFASTLNTISGDLNISNTGSGSIYLASATPLNLNIAGNFNQLGGSTIASTTSQSLLNIGGNLNMQGGTFNCTNSGLISNINISKDFIQTGGSFYAATSIGSTSIIVTGKYSQSNGTFDFNPNLSNSSTLLVYRDFIRTSGNFQHSGTGASGIVYFWGSIIQNISSSNASLDVNYLIYSNSIVSFASNFPIFNGSFTVYGTLLANTSNISGNPQSKFYSQKGSLIKSANLDPGGALTASASSGSVQTGVRVFYSGATYEFNGTASQNIGDFAAKSDTLNVTAQININNTAGVNLNYPFIISSNLNFISGKISTDNINILTMQPGAAFTGYGITSYVDGPVIKLLAANLNGSISYAFPVGAGSRYLPFSLVNPSTGVKGPSITIQAYGVNSGGISDGSSTAISGTEYWSAIVNSGNLTSSFVQIGRTISLGTYNTIAFSKISNGIYSSRNSIGKDANTLATNILLFKLGYFALANLGTGPTITSIIPATIGGTYTPPYYSAFASETITINGTNFISSGMTLKIDNVSVPYIFLNSSQVTAVVPRNIVTDYVVFTNTSTGYYAKEDFNFLGYITSQDGNWTSANSWLGNLMPPVNDNYTINNNIIVNTNIVSPINNLTISQNGVLNITPPLNRKSRHNYKYSIGKLWKS